METMTKKEIEAFKAFMSGDINQWFKVGLLNEIKDFPTISRKAKMTTTKAKAKAKAKTKVN